MSRRNLWIPPMLWKRVVKEAVAATQREGKPIGYAEIVRRSLEAYLTKQEKRP